MTARPYAANLPLELVTFAVCDVETTGLSPEDGDRVCEVACKRVRGGQELGRFSSLVDPECVLSEEAAQVNGITPELLAGAPRFAAVVEPLLSLVAGAVLVAHNAPFDVGFLSMELARAGHEMPRVPVVDTLRLARRVYRLRRYNLPALARALEIPARDSHQAMGDVETTAHLLRYLLEDMQRAYGVGCLGALVDFQGDGWQ